MNGRRPGGSGSGQGPLIALEAAAARACGAGLAVLYAVGVPYMALILNGYLGKGISAPALLWSGMLIYLPGDAAKIAVTALLCPVLRRRVPGLR